jgi:hypothetical protein
MNENMLSTKDTSKQINKGEEVKNVENLPQREEFLSSGAKLHESGKYYYKAGIYVEGGYKDGGRWKAELMQLLSAVKGDLITIWAPTPYEAKCFMHASKDHLFEGKTKDDFMFGNIDRDEMRLIAFKKMDIAKASRELDVPEDEFFTQLVMIIKEKINEVYNKDLSHMVSANSRETL